MRGVLLVLLLCACGRGGQPGAALDAYAAALRDKDYGAAYDLMSEGFRARYSRDEFVRRMKASGREAGAIANRSLSSKRITPEVG